MNEKILELLTQATPGMTPGILMMYSQQMDKFAKLIIQECAAVCMKEIDTGLMMAPKSPWMAQQVLDHFGVKE